MSTRVDLLALDAEKLTALSNKGFVKRAERDLEAGLVPSIEVEADGTVVATLEGVVTRLPPGTPLAETPCSCGALRACRHRVLAVRAYQAQHREAAPEPTATPTLPRFDDAALATLLDKRVLERAERVRRAGYVADVRVEAIPAVELSTCTVRFLVPSDLAYARCDCALGQRCEHVALAVWAAREAEGSSGARVTVSVGRSADARVDALDEALELARAVLLDGAEGSSGALEVRVARAEKPLEDAKLLWPRAICGELEEVLRAHAERRASYRPERLGALVTELFARARAGRGEGAIPSRVVLGMDEAARTLLEHVRLVSLGARIRREPLEPGKLRAHVDVHLADPDTLTVLVLRRSWDVGEDEVGAALGRRSVTKNVGLATLARGQVVSRSVERSANRELRIGTSRVAPTTVTPSTGRWEQLGEPLGFTRYAGLLERLRTLPPAFVRPRLLAERVHVLAVHEVAAVGYHAGEQTLRATLVDAEGTAVELALEHRAEAPGALDALARALAGHHGPLRFVSGEARREGERLVMTPLGAAVGERVLALDLEPPDAAAPLPPGGGAAPADPHVRALTQAREHLDVGAHHGLLHAPDGWRVELRTNAEHLERLGLRASAERLRRLEAKMAARVGHEVEARRALAHAWMEASLHLALALDAA